MPRGHWHQGNGRHQTDSVGKRQPLCSTPFKCTCSNLHWQMFQGKKVIKPEMPKCISSVYILSSYKYICLLVIFLFWKFHLNLWIVLTQLDKTFFRFVFLFSPLFSPPLPLFSSCSLHRSHRAMCNSKFDLRTLHVQILHALLGSFVIFCDWC